MQLPLLALGAQPVPCSAHSHVLAAIPEIRKRSRVGGAKGWLSAVFLHMLSNSLTYDDLSHELPNHRHEVDLIRVP